MRVEAAAKLFLKKADGKVGMLFDEDADGISSAALLLAFFKKKKIKAKAIAGKLEKKDFHNFAKQNFDYYIVLDLPVDQYLDFIEPLKGKKVLFIDHHPIAHDLNKFGFVYFNPRLKKPKTYISTAHVIYNLIKPYLKGFLWLMRLGAVGDHEIDGTEEEIEAVDIINAMLATKKKPSIEALVCFLSDCTRLEEFLYNEKYQKVKNLFIKELDRQIAKYESEAVDEITFFEVKSRYNITSILSTKLFEMYPNRTIILYSKKSPKLWSVSGRSQKYNLGKAFAKAAQGLGRGGGHPAAAGAHVNNFKVFKKRLLKLLTT